MQAAFIVLRRAIQQADARLKWANETSQPAYKVLAIQHELRELRQAYQVLLEEGSK